MAQYAITIHYKRPYSTGLPEMNIGSCAQLSALQFLGATTGKEAHPQIPVALICTSTSPRLGEYTGASTFFN